MTEQDERRRYEDKMDMTQSVGRAGFRAVHAKVGGKFPAHKKTGTTSRRPGSNRALIEEALRSIDEGVSRREAGKNPNIMLDEEWRNLNLVNDGECGLRAATSFDEPLASLAARNTQLWRKPAKADMELSELVVHLPANLCVEDPDQSHVSFVLDSDGQPVVTAVTGDRLTKPRMIPRDYDEARRYFEDAQAFLVMSVIPDGVCGIHARSDQYSEHRPHMQLIFDNFAPDPKHPGKLRNEFSRRWFSHRDVVYPEDHERAGRVISGRVKLSAMQAGFREFMIRRGWPVEAEIDRANEGVRRDKAGHAANDNQRRIAEDRLAAAHARERELDEFSEALDEEAAELRLKRHTAAREGYADGKAEGLAHAEQVRREVAEEQQAAIVARRAAEASRMEAEASLRHLREREEEYQVALAQLGAEYDRIADRPPAFEAYLDRPMKNGKTLRASFEHFTSRVEARHPSRNPRPRPRPSLPEQDAHRERGD